MAALTEQSGQGGSSGDVAPSPPARLTNARLVSPLEHGDGCVGLSGVFAIINGVRLALAHKHHFTGPEVHALMAAGFGFLDARLTARRCFMSGLRVELWRRLADAMVQASWRRTGHRLVVERLYVDHAFDRGAALAELEQAIRRMRVPLILCRGGHYTVVSGVTPSSVLLFDSGGACWLAKRVCGVPGDCTGARHVIYPASFLALVA